MANYAIGDLQGCYKEFSLLLEKISFNPSLDKLWLTGDLINRGPDSLKCLSLLYSLKKNCHIVLGNHDLHFLAIGEGVRKSNPEDTLSDVLMSEKKELFINWIASLPLIHSEVLNTNLGSIEFIMSHAGIPPHWSLKDTVEASNSIENQLQNKSKRKIFLKNMYGNKPSKEFHGISNMERLRLNTNYLTRMRFCSKNNELELDCKGPPSSAPDGYLPWFNYELKILTKKRHLIFGHWTNLQGKTNIRNISALDTGCVWGNYLKAIRLEDGREFRCNTVN